jgi:hypothetical protein
MPARAVIGPSSSPPGLAAIIAASHAHPDGRRFRRAPWSLAQGLREAGYAVDYVADGKRGLIHAQTPDYDVIVLDWVQYNMDGLGIFSSFGSRTFVMFPSF